MKDLDKRNKKTTQEMVRSHGRRKLDSKFQPLRSIPKTRMDGERMQISDRQTPFHVCGINSSQVKCF